MTNSQGHKSDSLIWRTEEWRQTFFVGHVACGSQWSFEMLSNREILTLHESHWSVWRDDEDSRLFKFLILLFDLEEISKEWKVWVKWRILEILWNSNILNLQFEEEKILSRNVENSHQKCHLRVKYWLFSITWLKLDHLCIKARI